MAFPSEKFVFMHALIYNIPAGRTEAYRAKRVILRSDSPREIAHVLRDWDLASVTYIQLTSLAAPVEELLCDLLPLPIDLVISDPAEFPLLYGFAPLRASRPVRVSMPIVADFSKAVRLAVSLGFTVKLEGAQPDDQATAELNDTLDYYLHQPTASQPIEFFHSLFLALYHQQPVTLWDIQEENPSYNRYVTDDGQETLAWRFSDPPFLPEKRNLLADSLECARCDFRRSCAGYFKWPDRTYSCTGIRQLLRNLAQAVDEIKQDLAQIDQSRREKVR